MLAEAEGPDDLFRRAIERRLRVAGLYDRLPRAFCPHALGWNAHGERRVFGWQFAGASQNPQGVPEWRCFGLDRWSELQLQSGPWHLGRKTKGHKQACVVRAEAIVPEDWTHAVLPQVR